MALRYRFSPGQIKSCQADRIAISPPLYFSFFECVAPSEPVIKDEEFGQNNSYNRRNTSGKSEYARKIAETLTGARALWQLALPLTRRCADGLESTSKLSLKADWQTIEESLELADTLEMRGALTCFS